MRAMGDPGLKKLGRPVGKDLEGGSRLNLKELNEFKEEILGPLKAFKKRPESAEHRLAR